jgi:hypothetical protein
MRRAALAILASAALAGCGGGGKDDTRASPTEGEPPATTAQAPPAPGPIRAQDISEHLQALQRIADRNDGNRAAGTKGDTETADYIAEQLRAAGWTVRFQTVKFPFFEETGRPVIDGLRRGSDFDVLEYSPGGDVRARVRALDTPACDAAALEPVRPGEIALVGRGQCTFRRKAMNAQLAGAAALLVADRGSRAPVAGTLGRPNGVDIPVLLVSGGAAGRLARRSTPVRLMLAHLDSVEEGPGINDNGSGIAALLETSRQLARRPGLRLGFWAAEELGLYGSRAYVQSLDRGRRNAIGAYVNLDMVGSPKPRPVVYDTDDRIERTLRRAFPGREGETGIGNASDHASFEDGGIATGGLFTGASEETDPCYHRACDTIRNADAGMAARMARAVTAALPRLAS